MSLSLSATKVESLWRYPVKSMRGEELDELFLGFPGVFGDRLYAFRDAAGRKALPYLTAREQHEMLQYRPRFRHAAKSARPPNLTDAEKVGAGLSPAPADPADLMIEVVTPGGQVLAIDDPSLVPMLMQGLGPGHDLTLVRSDRAMTDCRPISLISLQTIAQVSAEAGLTLDKRRFRANIFMDFGSAPGFSEDALVGRSVRIGSKAVLAILQRDARCKIITLDPETGESNPDVLRPVAQNHDNKAGVYAAVLVEGIIRRGDEISVLE